MKRNKYFENDPCNNGNNKDSCKSDLTGVNEIINNYVIIEKEQNDYATIYVCKKIGNINKNDCFSD